MRAKHEDRELAKDVAALESDGAMELREENDRLERELEDYKALRVIAIPQTILQARRLHAAACGFLHSFVAGDPTLIFTWESTPACWRCYYDPEGPQGLGKIKEEALMDLIYQCDDGHREILLAGAILAAIQQSHPKGG